MASVHSTKHKGYSVLTCKQEAYSIYLSLPSLDQVPSVHIESYRKTTKQLRLQVECGV